MLSHIVASRLRDVTSNPARRIRRLRELDVIVLTRKALCVRSTDPDAWYPITTDPDLYRAIAEERCVGCPFTGLAGPCLERALLMEHGRPRHQIDGIAAGTTPTERIALRVATPAQDDVEVAA
ncbi:hypothetical protein [Streptosporangium canum]|uniref:hypothetical protein n=1 Tax=Streptosporangium canum TaxID=324952 RepID=UPI0037A569EE